MEDNPYAEFSTLAIGDRFIGRHAARRSLVDIVGKGKASRAIVGLPRIGKSSLARVVLIEADEPDEVTGIWLDVSVIDPELSLVDALAASVARNLPVPAEEDLSYERLKSVLSANRRTGRRVVVVFDEFDAVRLTVNPTLSVRRLRELVIDPAKYGMSVVLVCRRELETIEDKIPDLSNLANACPTVNLRAFDEAELDELIARGFPTGLIAETRDRLSSITGRHPILVEQALMELFAGTSVRTLDQALRPAIKNLMSEISQLLTEAGLWDNMIAVARDGNSRYGAERERLLDYGAIVDDPDHCRIPFTALEQLALEAVDPSRTAWVTDAH